jgi:RNase H-like domain found in reverse transcriptase
MPTDIQKFLGFTGYYWYFIPNYSKVAQPLLELMKKATPWKWGARQIAAFKELKTRMCAAPVLMQSNFEKKFYLQVDASAYGMGAILLQEGNTMPTLVKCQKPILHPVAYYSTTFTPTKHSYNIYKHELLAVMKALYHWCHYLR